MSEEGTGLPTGITGASLRALSCSAGEVEGVRRDCGTVASAVGNYGVITRLARHELWCVPCGGGRATATTEDKGDFRRGLIRVKARGFSVSRRCSSSSNCLRATAIGDITLVLPRGSMVVGGNKVSGCSAGTGRC